MREMSVVNFFLLLTTIIFLILPTQGGHPCSPHHGAKIHKTDGQNSSQHSGYHYDQCELKESSARLVCSGGLHDEWNSGSETVRVLTLCRWPEDAFDAEALMHLFPSLQKLSIMNSNITSFSTYFPKEATELEHINLTLTKLEWLSNDTFSSLPALRVLDLKNNSFSDVNYTAMDLPSLQHIYLSGNPWICDSGKSWILDMRNGSVASKVMDKGEMMCAMPGRVLRNVVDITGRIMTLEKECIRTVCECELTHTTPSDAGFKSIISVNCSNRGLTEMPSFLPAMTATLYLSNNQISDLTPLLNNSVYQGVDIIYLDGNRIKSIELMEGSSWLEHFIVLDLRGNYLTNFPTYALENVLERYNRIVGIFLGNNPWSCDCFFTPAFLAFLNKHRELIKDIADVRCSSVSRVENRNKQIAGLTRANVCIEPTKSWLQPLDILNLVLASLILFVIGKLLYDYWAFKKTGKLPWIVAKIP